MSTNPKTLLVISLCPECGEPVGATKNHTAYRHGFNRHVVAISTSGKRSQEDGKRCKGSGQPVVYKRYHGWKAK